MPAMPRRSGKAAKIAFKILGKPISLQDKQTPSQKKLKEQLLAQETSRVR